MKKLVYLFAVGSLAFTACENAPSYKVTGTVENAADGAIVYLQEAQGRNLVSLDSAVVKGGTFTFNGRQDAAVNRYISYTNGDQRMMTDFFLENGNINVALAEAANNVGGTANNDAYQGFKSAYAALQKEMREIYMKMQQDNTLTDEQKAEMMAEMEAKNNATMDLVLKTIETNITNPVGVHLLPNYAYAFDLAQQKTLLEQIPAELCNERINKVKEHVATLEKTAVGQKFIDFSMPDPEGKTISLGEIIKKNKYTLIDFWASWCGPCRAEMPNVIDAYKAYSKKGFGIVGVSLDNDADKWKAAIKEMGMTWPQMSDVKGWQCEGAKLYGVNSIPATVLVDQEGTIIERNLRGDAIKAKLAELLK